MFKLPYSFMPLKTLRKYSFVFMGIAEFISPMFMFLKVNLNQAQIDIKQREYLSMCVFSTSIFFVFMSFIIFIFLLAFKVESIVTKAMLISLIFSLFVFFQQVMYPKLYSNRRVKDTEKNLFGALQNMLVQLNSGVPMFDVLVSVSKGDYGEVSNEFARAVKRINTGEPQVDVLRDIATVNPSLFFRRAIWQIVNGMKAGSDLSKVLEESINALSEEQVIQIQKYGGQLSPLAMFYMLVAVIIPSLGMTFLIIISSFISLSVSTTKLIFWGLYGIVLFFQIMFMGIIRTRRPTLLGE